MRGWKTILRWAAGLAIIAAMLAYLYSHWGEIRDQEFELRPLPAALAFLSFSAYLAGRGLIWHLLMRWEGVRESWAFDSAAWMVSVVAGKFIPGKVALYAGRLYWYRNSGISPLKLSVSFMIDTLATAMAASLVILAACFFPHPPEIDRYRFPAMLLSALALPFMHPKVMQLGLNFVTRALGRPRIEITLGFGQILLFILLLAVNWLFMGLGAYFSILAVAEMEPGRFLFVAAAFAISSVSGMLALFSPGGLGVREGVFALLIGTLVPAAVAALVALLARLWFTLAELAVVGIVYGIHRLEVRRGERARGDAAAPGVQRPTAIK